MPYGRDYPRIALEPLVLRGVLEDHAVAGVPSAEGGGALGVVAEKEVVHGVLLPGPTASQMGLHPDVDAGGVCRGAGLPGRAVEHVHEGRGYFPSVAPQQSVVAV